MTVEERLREALAARAGGINAADLRPAVLPARPARRKIVWFVPLLAGGAVAAVAVIFAVVLAWPSSPPKQAPAPPGDAPAATSPAPEPSPSATTRPTVVPRRTVTPSRYGTASPSAIATSPAGPTAAPTTTAP